jgi:dihydrofolate reductase
MRKIVSGLMVTVDGVYEGEDKWTAAYQSAEFGQAIGGLMMSGDTLLLGRTTYERFQEEFSTQSGGQADAMNFLPKHVVSNTLTSADWNNSTVIPGAELAERLAALKDGEGANINISGSGTLVRSLLEQGLLDELHLFVFPIVVGSGKGLFDGVESEFALELKSSETLTNGVLHHVYSRA